MPTRHRTEIAPYDVTCHACRATIKVHEPVLAEITQIRWLSSVSYYHPECKIIDKENQ